MKLAANCMQANGGYDGRYSPEEFLPIIADAIPFVDDYLAANPGDDALKDINRHMHGFLVDVRERWAKQETLSRIVALNDEGLELLNRGEFPEALAKFAEAEPLCREMEDEESLQTCLGNTALVLKSTGDLDRALELTGEKEAICRRLELHAALVNALANKANILELLHRVEEAVAAGAEADQICR